MNRPLLILDLDETLIHGRESLVPVPHDFRIEDIYVSKRPFVSEFIGECACVYDLAVWSSAADDYVEIIVNELFPGIHLEFVWSRERCTRRVDFESKEVYWVKDLKKVKRKGFDLARVLIVDDTAKKLERNYGNFIRVREFTGNEEDDELKRLYPYLLRLAAEANFRETEKRYWRDNV